MKPAYYDDAQNPIPESTPAIVASERTKQLLVMVLLLPADPAAPLLGNVQVIPEASNLICVLALLHDAVSTDGKHRVRLSASS